MSLDPESLSPLTLALKLRQEGAGEKNQIGKKTENISHAISSGRSSRACIAWA